MNENLKIETANNTTFLTYKIKPEDTVDNLSLEMLKNNTIPHLMPMTYSNVNGEEFIKYDVTAFTTVSNILKKPISKSQLLAVLNGIFDGILCLDEYMIPSSAIITDFDYMFYNEYKNELQLICFPINVDMQSSIDMKLLLKNILLCLQMKQGDEYISGSILNKLNQTQAFSIPDFKNYLQSLNPVTIDNSVNTTVQPQQPKQPVTSVKPTQQKQTLPNQLPNQNPVIPVKKPLQNNVQKDQLGKSGMKVPGKAPITNNTQMQNGAATVENKSNEPKMSLFYLLQHYNAENAAIYKQQKNAKKGNQVPQNVPKQPQKPMTSPGMNVPGGKNNNAVYSGQAINQPVAATQPKQVVVPPSKPLNFGETTVLGNGGAGETTVLNSSSVQQSSSVQPYLIRLKNNEKICINKPVFRIGKEKSYVDYFIGDNTAISRSHANIVMRGNKYFVVDTNSTNHTFVNDLIIESNKEVEITDATKIRFANEDFQFKLY